MADRTVTDVGGRAWMCVPTLTAAAGTAEPQGQDVVLVCSTPTVTAPVSITVGWRWESMAPNGLAKLITRASPVPRR
jgi:hypothetical protein